MTLEISPHNQIMFRVDVTCDLCGKPHNFLTVGMGPLVAELIWQDWTPALGKPYYQTWYCKGCAAEFMP